MTIQMTTATTCEVCKADFNWDDVSPQADGSVKYTLNGNEVGMYHVDGVVTHTQCDPPSPVILPTPTNGVASVTTMSVNTMQHTEACRYCYTASDKEGHVFDSSGAPRRARGQHERSCPHNPANGGTPVVHGRHTEQQGGAQKLVNVLQAGAEVKLGNTSLESSLLNPFGRSLVTELYALAKAHLPVALQGPTGMGKSSLMRIISAALGQEYRALNCQPGLNIDDLFGAPFPSNGPNGMEVIFRDGVLTQCVREGWIFLLEEMTMAPPEAMARFHGILDHGFRSLSLPESEERNVPVNDNFWFVATYNPHAKGYAASKLTKPILSRFAATFALDQPIVDEDRMLQARGLDDPLRASIGKFVRDLRKNEDTYVSTRDIALLAETITNGFTPMRAVEIGVAPKFGEHAQGVITSAKQFFGGA
jgi:MoxR-like ATPase